MEPEEGKCIPLTLPGLEIQGGTQKRITNLDMHIQYLVDVLVKGDITNVILLIIVKSPTIDKIVSIILF